MSERKLARVVIVEGLEPIEGKDRIEIAIVGGWQVIVQKGLYEVGSKAVFFEIDSLIDTERFPDTAKFGSKLMHCVNGITYARVKTMKMSGVISQGYMMPLHAATVGYDTPEDTDLTEHLGVRKYESVEEHVRNNHGGELVSRPKTFPAFVPKTDQNRVQNMTALYKKAVDEQEHFEVTVKLDGSSLTAWARNDGTDGVASRNVGFAYSAQRKSFWDTLKDYAKQVRRIGLSNASWNNLIPGDTNAFTEMAREAQLIEAIKADGRSLAIQGEMVGPSIQKNFEGVKKNEFYCFDIYLIDEGRYMLPAERRAFCTNHGINHTPVIYDGVLQHAEVKDVIAYASGPSGLNGKYREGIVFKAWDRDFSFKVISNEYLLKEK